MKRVFSLLVFAFLLLSPNQAQRRKSTVPPEPTITPQEAMEMYDFEKAQEILENEIERLTKKRQPTEELEELQKEKIQNIALIRIKSHKSRIF